MRSVFATILFLLLLGLYASPAHAQVACTSTSQIVPITPGQSTLTFTSTTHTTNQPNGQPHVTDYFAEVRQSGSTSVLTNFTIPKTALQPVSGIPNCYQTLLPAMSGLLPSSSSTTCTPATSCYTVTVTARGSGGTAVSAVASNPFFLPAPPPVAPDAPSNTTVRTGGLQ